MIWAPEGVTVDKVNRLGEWYRVTGAVHGQPTEVEIPSPDVEKLNRDDAFALFRRSLYRIYLAERQGRLR